MIKKIVLGIILIQIFIPLAYASGGNTTSAIKYSEDYFNVKNWKNYKNNKDPLNISFKYPQEWSINTNSSNQFLKIDTGPQSSIEISGSYDNFDDTRYEKKSEWLSKYPYSVSGLETYLQNNLGNEYYKEYWLIFRKNGIGYTVKFINRTDSPRYKIDERLFTEFTKTIKINDLTADWSLLKLDKYSLRYPKDLIKKENRGTVTLTSKTNNKKDKNYLKIVISNDGINDSTSLYGYSGKYNESDPKDQKSNFNYGNVYGDIRGFALIGLTNPKQNKNIVLIQEDGNIIKIVKEPLNNRTHDFRLLISSLKSI